MAGCGLEASLLYGKHMPYAVTLPIDEAAAARLRNILQAVNEQAGINDADRLGYGLHLTLAVMADTVPASGLKDVVLRATDHWIAFSMSLAGIGIFPGNPSILWALPVVTIDLLKRHAELHSALTQFQHDAHYTPCSWVPHITFSSEIPAASGLAVEAAVSAWRGPVCAEVKRVDFLRFKPVEVLASRLLRG